MRKLFYIIFLYSGIFNSFFGFSSSSLADDSGTENGGLVRIDFGKCIPDKKRVDTSFGSTTYQILGDASNGCLMKYGGEAENPDWNGFLSKTCHIPFSLGNMSFKRNDTGVDFTQIEKFCIDTPLQIKK